METIDRDVEVFGKRERTCNCDNAPDGWRHSILPDSTIISHLTGRHTI
jgi:hypothetical protein